MENLMQGDTRAPLFPLQESVVCLEAWKCQWKTKRKRQKVELIYTIHSIFSTEVFSFKTQRLHHWSEPLHTQQNNDTEPVVRAEIQSKSTIVPFFFHLANSLEQSDRTDISVTGP